MLPRVARLVRKRDYDYANAHNSNLLEQSALRVQLFVKLFSLVRVDKLEEKTIFYCFNIIFFFTNSTDQEIRHFVRLSTINKQNFSPEVVVEAVHPFHDDT